MSIWRRKISIELKCYLNEKVLTPSDNLLIPGMTFSEAIDWSTLGVPYRVARQLDIEEMYKADSNKNPRAETRSAIM